MPKYMYKSKAGDVRCGTARSLEHLESKHWVQPGTAKEIASLFDPEDEVDYANGTFKRHQPKLVKSATELRLEELEARLAKLEEKQS